MHSLLNFLYLFMARKVFLYVSQTWPDPMYEYMPIHNQNKHTLAHLSCIPMLKKTALGAVYGTSLSTCPCLFDLLRSTAAVQWQATQVTGKKAAGGQLALSVQTDADCTVSVLVHTIISLILISTFQSGETGKTWVIRVLMPQFKMYY